MNYKVIIYVFDLFLSVFVVSGLNINKIFKTNHVIEAKLFTVMLISIMTYLFSEFIFKFIELLVR